MRTFGTHGPVNPEDHYVVSRSEELADFITRVKLGRYIVIFAPRQTGKTTFFQWALDALTDDDTETYFPIELNFEVYEDYSADDFYSSVYESIYEEIECVFQRRGTAPSEDLVKFLENTKIADHVTMLIFFQQFGAFLGDESLIFLKSCYMLVIVKVLLGLCHEMRNDLGQHTSLSSESKLNLMKRTAY